jgi:NADH-quinone oxidoreductase subunit F
LPEAFVPRGTPSDERQYRVHLCFGPNCSGRGSRQLLPVLQLALLEAGLSEQVEILATTCRNRCDYGPSLNVYPGPVFYNELTEEAVLDIVERHLLHGTVADRWLYRPKLTCCGRRQAAR